MPYLPAWGEVDHHARRGKSCERFPLPPLELSRGQQTRSQTEGSICSASGRAPAGLRPGSDRAPTGLRPRSHGAPAGLGEPAEQENQLWSLRCSRLGQFWEHRKEVFFSISCRSFCDGDGSKLRAASLVKLYM